MSELLEKVAEKMGWSTWYSADRKLTCYVADIDGWCFDMTTPEGQLSVAGCFQLEDKLLRAGCWLLHTSDGDYVWWTDAQGSKASADPDRRTAAMLAIVEAV